MQNPLLGTVLGLAVRSSSVVEEQINERHCKKKIKAQAAARHTLNRGRQKFTMREVKCWSTDFKVTVWTRP